MCTAVYVQKYTSNQSFEWFLIFWIPDLDYDLLVSIFQTFSKKLSFWIAIFLRFSKTHLQLYFKCASEQILVKVWCLKYQKLFKTMIRSGFQGIYWCAHKTATLTSIQFTVRGRTSSLVLMKSRPTHPAFSGTFGALPQGTLGSTESTPTCPDPRGIGVSPRGPRGGTPFWTH